MAAVNPFRHIYDECNTGDPADKYRDLADFPLMIDIELTSACNFRCLMCPTGNLSLARKSEFMTPRTFSRVVAQCLEHGTALRFIGWGEPLLHPRVCDFISDAGNLPTHLNTNGSMIDDDLAEMLMGSGLTSMKFSFQGVDRKSYAEMRNTDWFEGLVETISRVRRHRGERPLPWLSASTTITDETPEMVEKFKKLLSPLVDELSIGKTVFDFMDLNAVRLRAQDKDRLTLLKSLESTEKRHPIPCPEVYTKLSVHADGSVVVCCNDHSGETNLGNVNNVPIAEIWRHPEMESYRERLARKEYTGPLCSVCYDYMDCTEK